MSAVPHYRTTREFVRAAREIFGNTYSYEQATYYTYTSYLSVTCRHHGPFEVKPKSHLENHKGCDICEKEKRFIERAKSIHKEAHYKYDKARYVDTLSPVIVICPIHGDFLITPNTHLSKSKPAGCQVCGTVKTRKIAYTQDWFLNRAKEIYGNLYDYSKSVYAGAHQPIIVTCKIHGDFVFDKAARHLYSRHRGGCPTCRTKGKIKVTGYSKKAIRWIETEAKRLRLKNVRHRENGGEVWLEDAGVKVDGYHARSRTVFEFHGDCWHGNPKKYRPRDRPNPYSTKTAKVLFRETKAREELIKSLGYNLITIWESDYDLKESGLSLPPRSYR